jgi:sodium transport system permease protein
MKVSSSFRRITTISKKELVEFARDWRTIFALLIIPLLMFPLLFIIFPLLLASEAAELDAIEVNVVIQSNDFPSDLAEQLNGSGIELRYEPLGMESNLSSPLEDGDRLRNGSIDAVLRMKENGSVWDYALLYMSTSERSQEARMRTLTDLFDWEENETEQRLVDAGLNPDETLRPLKWDGELSDSDVATSGEQAGMVLSLFIPLVLSVWTFSSAIQPSIDMTAGERERGTLEALLGLPCSRNELLFGKWLAVATITGIGVLLQLVGLLFAIGYLATTDFLTVPTLSIASIVFIGIAVLLFAIMVVAFELALAMRAHSVKEAGSILGPALLLILFPALFTQVINLDGIETFWFSIPVVNVLLALRELLMDRFVVEHIVTWIISSGVYAMAAALYAARQFKREDIVTSLS